MPSAVDYKTLLDNWSVLDEQRRADFIDWLYWLYERNNGLYTGLWQQFQQDLAEIVRDNLNEDQLFVEAIVHKINCGKLESKAVIQDD